MSTHVDRIIEEAIARGEMDNLPFKGQPIPIEDESGVPEELRMTHRILKNANIVPAEVEAMKAIAALRAELDEAVPERRDEIVRTILRKQALLKARLEAVAKQR